MPLRDSLNMAKMGDRANPSARSEQINERWIWVREEHDANNVCAPTPTTRLTYSFQLPRCSDKCPTDSIKVVDQWRNNNESDWKHNNG